jgi:hypothetical protein
MWGRGKGGDIDDAPAHPNCECTVEQKTKRVRVYESGVRIVEVEELGQPSPDLAQLHWMVTPNVVARDEDELDDVTSDLAEAAIEIAAAALAI